jgi:hypothetical protein
MSPVVWRVRLCGCPQLVVYSFVEELLMVSVCPSFQGTSAWARVGLLWAGLLRCGRVCSLWLGWRICLIRASFYGEGAGLHWVWRPARVCSSYSVPAGIVYERVVGSESGGVVLG